MVWGNNSLVVMLTAACLTVTFRGRILMSSCTLWHIQSGSVNFVINKILTSDTGEFWSSCECVQWYRGSAWIFNWGNFLLFLSYLVIISNTDFSFFGTYLLVTIMNKFYNFLSDLWLLFIQFFLLLLDFDYYHE